MRSRTVARAACALAVLLALAVGTGAATAQQSPATALTDGTSAEDSGGAVGAREAAPISNETPSIVALHPSPSRRGDAGESATVQFPTPTDASDWVLVDEVGHRARLPNRTLSGSVSLSPDPEAADRSGERTVLPIDGQLRLADDGDALALRRPDGTTVDRVSYDRARDGDRYVRTEAGWRWEHPHATDFGVATSEPEAATAFVLPDSPEIAVETLREATDRILLGAYTLTSERVVDGLIGAHQSGVEVAVVAEGEPVGGTSRAQVRALDRLASAGVDVTVRAGGRGRFRTHHPKYAVVDDAALVLTENWKPAGVGGRSSRGWGVRLADPDLADRLAALFRADTAGPGAVDWQSHRPTVDPVPTEPATGSFPARVEPERVDVERVRLLTAPDSAEPALPELVRDAEDTLRVQQVRVDPDGPLLAAALDAARDGVTVRLLLSSAWYVAEENRRVAAQLRDRADRQDLPLAVELAEPGSAFAKTHVKGAVIDDRRVVLGSLNWNAGAIRENREVLVVLEGEEPAAYYADAFESDRSERSGRLLGSASAVPAGLAAVVALAWLALAAVVATRVRWRA